MPRLDKETDSALYLFKIVKDMGDRAAYLTTGGRNAVHCSEDHSAIRIP